MVRRSVGRARPTPVNFVSFEFVAFLGTVYGLHWMLPQAGARKWLLTVASYLFYAAWNWRFCFLMLFVTANAFAAGHLTSSVPRPKRNRQLLIDAPPASPLRSRQNLRPCPRSRHKSARKSGLADRKNDRLTSSTSRRFPSEDYDLPGYREGPKWGMKASSRCQGRTAVVGFESGRGY